MARKYWVCEDCDICYSIKNRSCRKCKWCPFDKWACSKCKRLNLDTHFSCLTHKCYNKIPKEIFNTLPTIYETIWAKTRFRMFKIGRNNSKLIKLIEIDEDIDTLDKDEVSKLVIMLFRNCTNNIREKIIKTDTGYYFEEKNIPDTEDVMGNSVFGISSVPLFANNVFYDITPSVSGEMLVDFINSTLASLNSDSSSPPSHTKSPKNIDIEEDNLPDGDTNVDIAKCCICKDAKATWACLHLEDSLSHLCLCAECKKDERCYSNGCPICRQKVTHVIKVHT